MRSHKMHGNQQNVLMSARSFACTANHNSEAKLTRSARCCALVLSTRESERSNEAELPMRVSGAPCVRGN